MYHCVPSSIHRIGTWNGLTQIILCWISVRPMLTVHKTLQQKPDSQRVCETRTLGTFLYGTKTKTEMDNYSAIYTFLWLSPSFRPSLIRKFYQQKQFWHTDLSVTFVTTVLIVKSSNSLNRVGQMENVWSSQHGIFAFNKTLFFRFLAVFSRLSLCVLDDCFSFHCIVLLILFPQFLCFPPHDNNCRCCKSCQQVPGGYCSPKRASRFC